MMYSVWNQGAWKYDYYQSRAVQDTANAPPPRHMSRGKDSPMGLAPEQAAWPLPRDAVKVGQGEYPRGRIASRGAPRPVGSGTYGHGGSADGLGALAGIPVVEDIPPVGLAAMMLGAFWYWSNR